MVPRINIYKFRENDNTTVNYLSKSHPKFRDFIALRKLQKTGLNKYTEQFHSLFDFSEFKTDVIQFTYHYYSGEKSMNGKTLREYFFDTDSLNNYFLCTIDMGNNSQRTGKIKLDALIGDNTKPQNKNEVTFVIEGMEVELRAFLRTQTPGLMGWNDHTFTFDQWLHDFFTVPMPWLVVDNQLGIAAKAGFNPIASAPMYNSIIPQLKEGKKEALEQVALGLQFTYKMYCHFIEGFEGGFYPRFTISFFWRSESLGVTTSFKVSEDRDMISTDYGNEYVFIQAASFHEQVAIVGGDVLELDKREGTLIWQDNFGIQIAEGGLTGEQLGQLYDFSNDVLNIVIGSPPYTPIGLDSIKVIDVKMYDFFNIFANEAFTNYKISLARIFVSSFVVTYLNGIPGIITSYHDQGLPALLQATVKEESKILVQGLTFKKEQVVKYNENTNIKSGMRVFAGYVFIQGLQFKKYYYINRIYDIDLDREKQKATVELLLINKVFS